MCVYVFKVKSDDTTEISMLCLILTPKLQMWGCRKYFPSSCWCFSLLAVTNPWDFIIKKKTKKTSKHLKNSPPWWSECSSFHRACGLREKPERYRNRFSRRPEETRRVLCLLSSLHSRLWKRHECHFSGKFECSDISLYLIDRWLFISLCFFPSCPGQQVHTSHSTHPTLGGTAPQWNEFKSSFQQDALNDYGSLVLKLRHYCIGISYSASAFFKFRSPLSPCLQGQTEKWIIIVSLWSPILSIHQHWSLHLF